MDDDEDQAQSNNNEEAEQEQSRLCDLANIDQYYGSDGILRSIA